MPDSPPVAAALPAADAPRPGSGPPGRMTRAAVAGLVVLAAAVTLLLLAHDLVPAGAGSAVLLDSFLPWFGLAVPVIAAGALLARSRAALAATLVPAVAWAAQFGPALTHRGPGGQADLRVVSFNLSAANPDPGRSAGELVRTRADVVAVQEVTRAQSRSVGRVLGGAYGYHARIATVGVWSRYPLQGVRPVDTGMGWTRAVRAEVSSPRGALAVYVVHLASIRPGESAGRDRTLRRLAQRVAADPARRLIVLGDLNTASTDRAMRRLPRSLRDAQAEAGRGLGFTWPARFPLTRPDHVLYRGMTAVDSRVTRISGSDHRAAVAAFRF